MCIIIRLSSEHKQYNKTLGMHSCVDDRTRHRTSLPTQAPGLHWCSCLEREKTKARDRRPLTDALVKVPHKKILPSPRNINIGVWCGKCAKQFAVPPGKANVTASTRDPRAGGQQKTLGGTAYQCKLKACPGPGALTPLGNCRECRPLTDALAQVPGKTLLA